MNIALSYTSHVNLRSFHSLSLHFKIEQATWIVTITRLLRSLEMRLSLFIWTTAEGKSSLLMCNVLSVLHSSLLKAPQALPFYTETMETECFCLKRCEYVDAERKVRFICRRVSGCNMCAVEGLAVGRSHTGARTDKGFWLNWHSAWPKRQIFHSLHLLLK